MLKSLLISVLALSAATFSQARPLRLDNASTQCPLSLTTCLIGTSLECVDVRTDPTQCGACQGDGGVDCTMLEGVLTAGCVDGRCEVWSCTRGFDYLLETKSCVPAYP